MLCTILKEMNQEKKETSVEDTLVKEEDMSANNNEKKEDMSVNDEEEKGKEEEKVKRISPEEERILKYLEQKDGYAPTIEIAREIFGAKGKASQVNPALYGLLTKRLVRKRQRKTAANHAGS